MLHLYQIKRHCGGGPCPDKATNIFCFPGQKEVFSSLMEEKKGGPDMEGLELFGNYLDCCSAEEAPEIGKHFDLKGFSNVCHIAGKTYLCLIQHISF